MPLRTAISQRGPVTHSCFNAEDAKGGAVGVRLRLRKQGEGLSEHDPCLQAKQGTFCTVDRARGIEGMQKSSRTDHVSRET